MAQFVRTIVELVDDLDGGPGDRTIEFTWAGTDLVIDLSEENALKFTVAVEPYVNAARPRPKPKRKQKGSAKSKTVAAEPDKYGPEAAAKAQRDRIRRWGRNNGYTVSNFSKVPQAVVEAYEAAHHAAPSAAHRDSSKGVKTQ